MDSNYEKYLQSEQWKKRREARLIIDKHKCVLCGTKENLCIHHLSYKNIQNEDINRDLITLCKYHHERWHEVLDKMRDDYRFNDELFTRKLLSSVVNNSNQNARQAITNHIFEEAVAIAQSMKDVLGDRKSVINNIRYANKVRNYLHRTTEITDDGLIWGLIQHNPADVINVCYRILRGKKKYGAINCISDVPKYIDNSIRNS